MGVPNTSQQPRADGRAFSQRDIRRRPPHKKADGMSSGSNSFSTRPRYSNGRTSSYRIGRPPNPVDLGVDLLLDNRMLGESAEHGCRHAARGLGSGEHRGDQFVVNLLIGHAAARDVVMCGQQNSQPGRREFRSRRDMFDGVVDHGTRAVLRGVVTSHGW
jgi:hypothetical protein